MHAKKPESISYVTFLLHIGCKVYAIKNREKTREDKDADPENRLYARVR